MVINLCDCDITTCLTQGVELVEHHSSLPKHMNTCNKFGGVLICGVEPIKQVVMLDFLSFINLCKKRKEKKNNLF